ncbi:hypothetical protein [Acidicapsa ligni]|uniref:hypothetical protein n=1 Tax=Acidicapsa ligni TaxID=542300 RepID=UPI0021E0C26E|nr:hypothetical protein [Acidicapsa ligni]
MTHVPKSSSEPDAAVFQSGPSSSSPSSSPSSSRSNRATLEPWVPQSAAEKSAVLAQLDLLLVHPLFSQSKRYPTLLRYVVEQTLDGQADQIKERSIAIEVFNRPPTYDSNADPIVRVTAGEIRKRLAQYYYDPSHADELRIELPTGSYVPVFQRLTELAVERIPTPIDAQIPVSIPVSIDLSAALPLEPAAPVEYSQPAPLAPPTAHPAAFHLPAQRQHHPSHPFALTALLVVLALVGGLIAGYTYRHSKTPIAIPVDHTVDDFWQPLTAGPATVTFCLGEPARDSSGDDDPSKPIRRTQPTEPLYFKLRQSGLFALADVVSLTRMSAPLQKQHKAFRVSAASEASYAQLREGPAVLIGAYDNLWTMRLTRDLRFGFDSIDGKARIIDRKSPSKTTWSTAWDIPSVNLTRDYAIVARYRDTMIGQPVVLASGISEEGTEAAGELVSNPTDLAALLKHAPANWRNMNMEAVIETQVIDGHSGPPQVLAVEFW